nr:reverse transcriptase domain-containing protein [Tanacetum cinerariifolium]
KCKALADLGASINLIPLSIWKKLGLPELIFTRMTLELVNLANCTPAGIARDVFVPVGKFTSPSDFVIVDYESDSRVPLILGRPLLRSALLKPLSSSPIPVEDSDSFLEKSDTSLSLPEYETFIDHTEETNSGSTTAHANNSLHEYDSFCFEIEPAQGRLTSVVSDNSKNNPLLEEVDLFLASDNSIPSGEVISAVMNNIIEDECFNPGGEIDVFTNIKDDDYIPFIFVIRIFLPYLIYPEVSPLLLSVGSEDTVFDLGISILSWWHLIGMELSCALMFIQTLRKA